MGNNNTMDNNEYNNLVKILRKEKISVSELRSITNNDLVAQISEAKPDNRYKKCIKYDIKLSNGELYYVYVKKTFLGLF